MVLNNRAFKILCKKMGAGFLCALLLCGCGGDKVKTKAQMNSTTFFAMDTVMEIQIAGDEELLSGAEDMVMNLESQLSVTEDDSQVSQLNKNKIGRLTGQGAEVFKGGLDICKATEGALDLSIYPVLKEWGFTTGDYKVPQEDEINQLLENVDYSKIEVADSGNDYVDVVLPENMEIDLGSIVKGYTGTALADYFKENGVQSALINLGGNVQCIGQKQDGSDWKIAIKSPFPDSESGIIGVLQARDTAVVTSGGYERYFEKNGEVYWHIIDPTNGCPAKNGLVSVSIVGQDGLMCDGLSTALFVKGLEGATDYWKNHEDFDVIMVTDEGEVYITEGIKDTFSLSPEYSNSKLNVITK